MNDAIKDSLEKITDAERHKLTAYIEELERRVEQQELLLEEANNRLASQPDKDKADHPYPIRQLLFSLPGAVCLYNFQERQLLDSDQHFCSMFRCPDGLIDTTHFLQIFPEKQPDGSLTLDLMLEGRIKAVDTGNAQRLPLFFRKLDGTLFPAEVTILPDPEQASNIYLIFRDYSRAYAQKKALEESELRYREFIDLAPVGICKVDVFGNIALNSAMADAMLGYDRRENEGTPIISLLHSDDQKLYAEKVIEMLSGQREVVFSEVRVRRKDGEYMWFRGGSKLHVDESGVPLYVLVTFMDISEIKQAEALLREREAIYQAVVSNATEGIDIVDVSNYHPVNNPCGEILLRNERMKRLFQSPDELFGTREALGKIVPLIQPNGERSMELFDRIVKRLYKQGKSKEVIRFQHSANLYFDVEATEQRLEISGKKLLVRVYHDITERVKQEELIQYQLRQLNQQNRELQTYIESNMQLENFAYIASHDLRAPIGTIVNFANLLENQLGARLKHTEREYLTFIRQSAVSMQLLIEDLLKFSRANTVKRELTSVNLQKLQQELQIEFRTQLENTSGQLTWEKLEYNITADRIKLKQLLQNLISNGLKFTKADQSPKVNVSLSEEKNYWRFVIQDNGIGIEEEFKNTIFLIFKRLHNQQQYDGTGIGLALCKKLVEQHDGRIWVDSKVGEGSRFYFTIRKGLSD
ncbi:MAG: ATP-binding protein [Bacteroidota bacterium]